mgnify:CR=1 FL=1
MKKTIKILGILVLLGILIGIGISDFFSKKAYNHISFEQEAFTYMSNLNYLKTRKHFAQWRK